jgi:hypothetical protein
MLNLQVLPGKVPQEQWNGVYRESLKLLDAYPFMDFVYDKKTLSSYGLTFTCGTRSREKDINGHKGWHAVGDCVTMRSGDGFTLLDHLPKSQAAEESDILECLAGKSSGERLFDAKTQGFDYHNHLLAVGLLVESRLSHGQWLREM